MLRSAWRTVPPAANRCESWFRRGCATATPPAFVAVEGSSNELLSSIDLSLRWRECYEVLLPRQRLSPRAVLATDHGDGVPTGTKANGDLVGSGLGRGVCAGGNHPVREVAPKRGHQKTGGTGGDRGHAHDELDQCQPLVGR